AVPEFEVLQTTVEAWPVVGLSDLLPEVEQVAWMTPMDLGNASKAERGTWNLSRWAAYPAFVAIIGHPRRYVSVRNCKVSNGSDSQTLAVDAELDDDEAVIMVPDAPVGVAAGGSPIDGVDLISLLQIKLIFFHINIMAELDLTPKISSYLDRHMVFPLLEFLSMKEIYDVNDLMEGKLNLLSDTNMVDYAREVYRNLHGEDGGPEHLLQKRADVVAQLKQYQEETEPILNIFVKKEVQQQFKTARDFRQLQEFLVENYQFRPDMIDTLYNFAKFQYECGNYAGSAEYLDFYRILVPSSDRNYLSGLWGKLASEILMQHWDVALEDLNRVKDYIENQLSVFGSALEALQQRAWLLHWSLFVFFNHPKGKDLIIDMFLYQPPYLNTIQTMCPHLLRYLSTAVIINKQHRRAVMKDLVKAIQQESYTYSDPITEFLEDLCVNFDFDRAQQKLRDCRDLLYQDFFLTACLDDFMENARLMIFETFCRIHQCISISMLAEKLNMTDEEAERWIVNLIRHARLDAKIDSSKGHVVMGTQAVSPYSQLIEKTKALSLRTQMLALQIEKRITTVRAGEVSLFFSLVRSGEDRTSKTQQRCTILIFSTIRRSVKKKNAAVSRVAHVLCSIAFLSVSSPKVLRAMESSTTDQSSDELSTYGQCDICEEHSAKYKCPRCDKRTCSLSCVKKHKVRYDCCGQRDRAKFVPVKKFSNLDLLNDYRFLEEAARVAERCHKDKTRLISRTAPHSSLPPSVGFAGCVVLMRAEGNHRLGVKKVDFSKRGPRDTESPRDKIPDTKSPPYPRTALDLKRSLKDNLKGKLVVEHPELFVFTLPHIETLDIIEEVNDLIEWEGPEEEKDIDDCHPSEQGSHHDEPEGELTEADFDRHYSNYYKEFMQHYAKIYGIKNPDDLPEDIRFKANLFSEARTAQSSGHDHLEKESRKRKIVSYGEIDDTIIIQAIIEELWCVHFGVSEIMRTDLVGRSHHRLICLSFAHDVSFILTAAMVGLLSSIPSRHDVGTIINLYEDQNLGVLRTDLKNIYVFSVDVVKNGISIAEGSRVRFNLDARSNVTALDVETMVKSREEKVPAEIEIAEESVLKNCEVEIEDSDKNVEDTDQISDCQDNLSDTPKVIDAAEKLPSWPEIMVVEGIVQKEAADEVTVEIDNGDTVRFSKKLCCGEFKDKWTFLDRDLVLLRIRKGTKDVEVLSCAVRYREVWSKAEISSDKTRLSYNGNSSLISNARHGVLKDSDEFCFAVVIKTARERVPWRSVDIRRSCSNFRGQENPLSQAFHTNLMLRNRYDDDCEDVEVTYGLSFGIVSLGETSDKYSMTAKNQGTTTRTLKSVKVTSMENIFKIVEGSFPVDLLPGDLEAFWLVCSLEELDALPPYSTGEIVFEFEDFDVRRLLCARMITPDETVARDESVPGAVCRPGKAYVNRPNRKSTYEYRYEIDPELRRAVLDGDDLGLCAPVLQRNLTREDYAAFFQKLVEIEIAAMVGLLSSIPSRHDVGTIINLFEDQNLGVIRTDLKNIYVFSVDVVKNGISVAEGSRVRFNLDARSNVTALDVETMVKSREEKVRAEIEIAEESVLKNCKVEIEDSDKNVEDTDQISDLQDNLSDTTTDIDAAEKLPSWPEIIEVEGVVQKDAADEVTVEIDNGDIVRFSKKLCCGEFKDKWTFMDRDLVLLRILKDTKDVEVLSCAVRYREVWSKAEISSHKDRLSYNGNSGLISNARHGVLKDSDEFCFAVVIKTARERVPWRSVDIRRSCSNFRGQENPLSQAFHTNLMLRNRYDDDCQDVKVTYGRYFGTVSLGETSEKYSMTAKNQGTTTHTLKSVKVTSMENIFKVVEGSFPVDLLPGDFQAFGLVCSLEELDALPPYSTGEIVFEFEDFDVHRLLSARMITPDETVTRDESVPGAVCRPGEVYVNGPSWKSTYEYRYEYLGLNAARHDLPLLEPDTRGQEIDEIQRLEQMRITGAILSEEGDLLGIDASSLFDDEEEGLCLPTSPVNMSDERDLEDLVDISDDTEALNGAEASTHDRILLDHLLSIKQYLQPGICVSITEARSLSSWLPVDDLVWFMARARDASTVPMNCKEHIQKNEGYEAKMRVANARIVVATWYMCGSMPEKLNQGSGPFTHVFVDEAGHMTEPMCLVPLTASRNWTRIVLAGDPMQLSPVVFSRVAQMYKLKRSFMERLMEDHSFYMKVEDKYRWEFVTQLVMNYRSHPMILSMYSNLSYDGVLQACVKPEDNLDWIPLTFRRFYPFCVIGLHDSHCERLRKNPSPFNMKEAYEVTRMILVTRLFGCPNNRVTKPQFGGLGICEAKNCPGWRLDRLALDDRQVRDRELTDRRLTGHAFSQNWISHIVNDFMAHGMVLQSDIGVISPYRSQCRRIQIFLRNFPDIKIGTVEEFQGAERKIIILSLVHTCHDGRKGKLFWSESFFASRKHTNVSISRAKQFLIVIGDVPLMRKGKKNWGTILELAEAGGGKHLKCSKKAFK
ncbi:unnamed protein product, partial [Notodromas monacha]